MSDIEEQVVPGPSRGRKRVRDEKEWKQNVAKRRRNTGQAYVSCSTNMILRYRTLLFRSDSDTL